MAVVVGYDESPGADVALDTAIQVAARWGEPLILVYGAGPPGGMGEEVSAHRAALREIGRIRALARRSSGPRAPRSTPRSSSSTPSPPRR